MDESWESLPKSRSKVGIVKKKKKIFLKAGKAKQAAATVVFVPSTRGSILLKSLKEDEERMANEDGLEMGERKPVLYKVLGGGGQSIRKISIKKDSFSPGWHDE